MGTVAGNVELGLRRANGIRAQLVQAGIGADVPREERKWYG
jgi:outer membrane protein OmpA-like peptidoglycan-associated protein